MEVLADTPKRQPQNKKCRREAVWETDHDYIHTKLCSTEDDDVVLLHHRLQVLEAEKQQLQGQVLSLENLKSNDKKFLFYTGMPNYACFKGNALHTTQ